MIYPDDMDKECINLCNALNSIKGIQTVESCCGHGKHGYWIFFHTKSFVALSKVAYYAMTCHSGASGWQVVANTDGRMKRYLFLLEGPSGDYEGAEKIAKAIMKDQV
jgi:tRNA(Phe) wybutosine-synthesizing methylase Tyw3